MRRDHGGGAPAPDAMLREPLTLAAAGAVLAVYAGVLGLMPKGAFWSPDEGAKFIQMRSIGWDGGLRYEIPYAGAAIDPEHAFYPTACRHDDLYPVRVDGNVRFHWPIWFPLASAVGFAALGEAGIYVVPLAGAWLTALAAGALVRHHDRRLTPAAILVVGLASPLFFYALTFWEHTLATALALAALCIVAASPPLRWKTVALAAPLLAGAAVLRVEMIGFAAALVFAWLAAGRLCGAPWPLPDRRWWTRRRSVVVALAVLAAVAAVLVIASYLLTWRHRWLLGVLPRYAFDNLVKLPFAPSTLLSVFVNSPGEQAPVVATAWQVAALAAFALAVAAAFLRSERWQAMVGLAALFVALQFSLLLGFLPQPYLSVHGFLPVAPYVVVAAWALPHVWRRRDHGSLVVAATAVLYLLCGFAVVFTFAVDRDGTYRTGLEWGTRYLLTLYPILAVLALMGADVFRRADRPKLVKRAFLLLAACLVLVGVQFQVRGLRMLYASRATVAAWQSALPSEVPVLTDVWWLPAAMAPLFTRQPMFCARGVGKMEGWVSAAAERGVRKFVFAGFHGLDPAAFGRSPVRVRAGERSVVSGLQISRFEMTSESGGAR